MKLINLAHGRARDVLRTVKKVSACRRDACRAHVWRTITATVPSNPLSEQSFYVPEIPEWSFQGTANMRFDFQ